MKKKLYHTPCDGTDATVHYPVPYRTVSYPVAYWISHYHTHTTDRRYGTLPGPIPYIIPRRILNNIISYPHDGQTLRYTTRSHTVLVPYHTPSHIEYHIIIPTRRTDATVHYPVPYHTSYPIAYWIISYRIIPPRWTDATVHYPVPYRTSSYPSHIEYWISYHILNIEYRIPFYSSTCIIKVVYYYVMVWVLIFDDLFDELSSFEYCMWSVLSKNNPSAHSSYLSNIFVLNKQLHFNSSTYTKV